MGSSRRLPSLPLSDADIRWQRPRSADRNPHRRLQPQKRKSLDPTADLLRYQIDHDHHPNAHLAGVPVRKPESGSEPRLKSP